MQYFLLEFCIERACKGICNGSAYKITVFPYSHTHFALFRIPPHSKGLHYRSCEIQVSDLDRRRWIALGIEICRERERARHTPQWASKRPSAKEGESSCEFYANPIAGWNRLHRSVKSICADNASVNGPDIVSTFPFLADSYIMSLSEAVFEKSVHYFS